MPLYLWGQITIPVEKEAEGIPETVWTFRTGLTTLAPSENQPSLGAVQPRT